MQNYNQYQTMNYKLAYSTDIGKREKVSHWAVYYGNRQLTTPMNYALCKTNLNNFKMQGIEFPNRELLKIRPAV